MRGGIVGTEREPVRRCLAGHSPASRAQDWTYGIAYRLFRGGRLFEDQALGEG